VKFCYQNQGSIFQTQIAYRRGYLKEKVYANKPQSLMELEENITREIKEITPETLENVMAEVIERKWKAYAGCCFRT
jgi:hypothetical protein